MRIINFLVTLVVIGLFVAVMVVSNSKPVSPENDQPAAHDFIPHPAPPPRPMNWPDGYDPAKKSGRDKWVSDVLNSGQIFEKIYGIEVTAGPSFYQCTFEEKQNFAYIVFCWELDRDPSTPGISIIEPMDHHEIGSFVWPGGLTMK